MNWARRDSLRDYPDVEYAQSRSAIPDPGQWSQVGSGLNMNLKYSSLKDQGIVNGPVSITLDWNKIKSIRLLRSQEDSQRITIEPELLGVLSAEGSGPELCRPVVLEKIPSPADRRHPGH